MSYFQAKTLNLSPGIPQLPVMIDLSAFGHKMVQVHEAVELKISVNAAIKGFNHI